MASVETTETAGTISLLDNRSEADRRLPGRVAPGERGLASVMGGGGAETFATKFAKPNRSCLEARLGQSQWPACVTRLQENPDSFDRL